MYVLKSKNPLMSDRPLMYIFVYLMAKKFGIEATVKAMPVICSLTFAISSYILFRKMFKEKWIHIVGTYLSICSTTTTIGLFGGLYTNWLAWAVSLVMLACCFSRGKVALLSAPISLLLMGIHPYHWIVVQTTIAMYCIITTLLFLKSKDKAYIFENTGFYTSCISIAVGLAIYLLKLHVNPLAGLLNGYLRYYFSLIENPFKLFNNYWWERVSKETYNYGMAGYYNATILTLGAISGLMTSLKEKTHRLTFSWLAVLSALFLVPIGVEPWGQQWRVLYEIPIGLLATRGLVRITKLPRVSSILSIAIILQQISYTLRYIMLLCRS